MLIFPPRCVPSQIDKARVALLSHIHLAPASLSKFVVIEYNTLRRRAVRESNTIVDIPAMPHVWVTDKLQYILLYHTAYLLFSTPFSYLFYNNILRFINVSVVVVFSLIFKQISFFSSYKM